MDALIVYPENKAQLKQLKAVLKALNVNFKQQADTPDWIIEGVNKSIAEANEGKLTPYTGIKDMLK